MLDGPRYDDVRMVLLASDKPLPAYAVRNILPAASQTALSAMIAIGEVRQTVDGEVYLPTRTEVERERRASPVPREVR